MFESLSGKDSKFLQHLLGGAVMNLAMQAKVFRNFQGDSYSHDDL